MEVLLDLTKMQQKFFVIVQRAGRAGITSDTIIDSLYDGETGPCSRNILHVMKSHMQPKLHKHKLKMTTRTGPNARWRVDVI
jgi:hypothetical protein